MLSARGLGLEAGERRRAGFERGVDGVVGDVGEKGAAAVGFDEVAGGAGEGVDALGVGGLVAALIWIGAGVEGDVEALGFGRTGAGAEVPFAEVAGGAAGGFEGFGEGEVGGVGRRASRGCRSGGN